MYIFHSTLIRMVKYENLIFRRREIWYKRYKKKRIAIIVVLNKQSFLTILNHGSTNLLTVPECGPITLLTVT